MSRRLCVVGLGELVWDLLPDRKTPGGVPANFAYHASQLGCEARVVSAVGSDSDGDELLNWMNRNGLSTLGVARNHRPTGSVSVFSNEHGPSYHIYENVAWDHLIWDAGLANIAAETACVCVGTLAQRSPASRQTVQRFLAATPRDCLRVFDVNLRSPSVDPDVIHGTLALTDVLKVNHHEWPIVAQLLKLDADVLLGARQLIQKSPVKIIAVTNGKGGSMVIDQNTSHELPARKVKVVDTVGAGDSFTAALAVNLLQGATLEKAHIHATKVSAYVCAHAGATPVLPSSLRGVTRIGSGAASVRRLAKDIIRRLEPPVPS